MTKKTHHTLVIALLCAFFHSNTACISVANGQKLVKKAELQASNGDVEDAIKTTIKYIADHPSDYAAKANLAELYAEVGQITEAIATYEAIAAEPNLAAKHRRIYGNLLKQMSKYDEAVVQYLIFKQSEPFYGDHLIASCMYAKEKMASSSTYETLLMPTNSSASDFGLTFYKDAPVFSSFRNDILLTEVEREFNPQEGAHKSYVYNSKKNRLAFIKNMDSKLNHIGPISFSANGLNCAMIESKISDRMSTIIPYKSSSLTLATLNEKGEIENAKPFSHNEVGSSIVSVHLAFDGTALYFASNRSGGMGGFDLYVSYLDNDHWSLPKNLGPSINTSGNEVTPFLKGNELLFASDFHEGLGGYDIFKSVAVNGNWSQPSNLGLGINTPSDDYYPSVSNLGEVYITSNRLGGKGMNDIYKCIKINNEPAPMMAMTEMPKAVSLEELEAETMEHVVDINQARAVSLQSSGMDVNNEIVNKIAFELPAFDPEKVGTNAIGTLSYEGAHRVGLDMMIPLTEVFFIQLASMSSVKPNFDKFKSLVKFGNIYKMKGDRTIKVRLGYYVDRKEAEAVLTKVRNNGYRDAFITFEILNTAQMELVLASTDDNSFTDEGNLNSKNPTAEMVSFKVGGKYKVRLASYEDPIWFDVNKVKDIGRIEQWTKGGWTIFILAGFNNLEEAKNAHIQAMNRGFKTAEVVIDNGGILERLKQN